MGAKMYSPMDSCLTKLKRKSSHRFYRGGILESSNCKTPTVGESSIICMISDSGDTRPTDSVLR